MHNSCALLVFLLLQLVVAQDSGNITISAKPPPPVESIGRLIKDALISGGVSLLLFILILYENFSPSHANTPNDTHHEMTTSKNKGGDDVLNQGLLLGPIMQEVTCAPTTTSTSPKFRPTQDPPGNSTNLATAALPLQHALDKVTPKKKGSLRTNRVDKKEAVDDDML